MEKNREILFKDAALEKLCAGALVFIHRKDLSFSDPFLAMGASIAQEAQEKSKDNTTLLLLRALIENGQKQIKAGTCPIALKKEMKKWASFILENLARSSPTPEQMLSIATNAASGDASIGHLIAQAVQKEIVLIEEERSTETTLSIRSGMQLDCGYLSPYFCTSSDKRLSELHNVDFLLTDKKINSSQEVNVHLQPYAKTGRSLLIIADDISKDALSTLIINHLHGTIKLCAVKKGSLLPPCSSAEKVLVYKNKTILFNPKLQNSSIAMLHIGGKTETQIRQKRELFETSLYAAQAALKDGIANLPSLSQKNENTTIQAVLDICTSLFAETKPYRLIQQSLTTAFSAAEKILLSDVLIGYRN